MSQGKCSLLKPVDSLTGTFFLFSQYAQDLTKQYSNPDEYRCVPSKYIALNLDFGGVTPSSYKDTDSDEVRLSRSLGEIFQNYYENSCAFLRAKMEEENNISWKPEYARTLLFQTLEKYGMIRFENTTAIKNESNQIISGVSKQIQYIGDINIYSYNNDPDGIGYNEIYCYIPNEAKNYNYQCSVVQTNEFTPLYSGEQICGYSGAPYNDLSWTLKYGAPFLPFIDEYEVNGVNVGSYKIGEYSNISNIEFDPENTTNYNLTLVPDILAQNTSNDSERLDTQYDINAIVVLYDVVNKNTNFVKHKNIPLGIYFTGVLQNDNKTMTNIITKYVNSGQIYNQGTSYGLRICTRFLSTPNTTEIQDVSTNGSTNISEMAPVLEKMGETLLEIQESIDKKEEIYDILENHLSQFKNNKVNVPYVRSLGNKKYWFVNGKNTGAIAQYDYSDPTYIITETIKEILSDVYTKSQIDSMFNSTIEQHNESINSVMNEISRLEARVQELESK